MTTLRILACVLGILSITAAVPISGAPGGNSSCKLDLVLVVDVTESIREEKNIPKVIEVLQLFVQQFHVSADGTHVSFATFADESTVHNSLNDPNYYTEDAVLALINSTINKLTRPTRLDNALKKADEVQLNGVRKSVSTVVVLITDGRSHPRDTNFDALRDHVYRIKSRGARLIVIGIGPAAQRERYRRVLKEIGGKDVYYSDGYDELGLGISNSTEIICPPSTCKDSPGMDVAFLVDRTKSIGDVNYQLLKGFLLQLAGALTIGHNATHTGIILFAKYPSLKNTFSDPNFHSNAAVRHQIDGFDDTLGRPTFTDRALIEANLSLFTEEGGDRTWFPNVLILLTDGQTNTASKPFSEIIPSLEAKGVRNIAVGVGDYEKFQDQLEEIAGPDRVFNAFNFQELSDLFHVILNEICSTKAGWYSAWRPWSPCSDAGIKTRTRTCINSTPHGKGIGCVGPRMETKPCGVGAKRARGLSEFRLPGKEKDWNFGHPSTD